MLAFPSTKSQKINTIESIDSILQNKNISLKKNRLILVLSLDGSKGLYLYTNLSDAYEASATGKQIFNIFEAALIIKSAVRKRTSLRFDIEDGFNAFVGKQLITSSEI